MAHSHRAQSLLVIVMTHVNSNKSHWPAEQPNLVVWNEVTTAKAPYRYGCGPTRGTTAAHTHTFLVWSGIRLQILTTPRLHTPTHRHDGVRSEKMMKHRRVWQWCGSATRPGKLDFKMGLCVTGASRRTSLSSDAYPRW